MESLRTLLGGAARSFSTLITHIATLTVSHLPFRRVLPEASPSAHRTQPPPTGIIFSPAPHQAGSFPETARLSPSEILKESCPDLYPTCKRMLCSSFDDTSNIIPQSNGFVRTVLESYNNHRALVLRPDDVWIAIMTQFYCYVNGRAEELRSQFVLHDGKQELTMVVKEHVDMDTLIGLFAEHMTLAVQEKVVDPELRSWMLPAFSTTTRTDLITSASIMLGTMKEYFTYRIMLLCGIPRVTLLGNKQDWEAILSKIEKLKEFGSEAVSWHRLLHPVLSRFVQAFEAPHHTDNHDFWNKVAHLQRLGSGPTWLSGWITAFMMFDEKGRCQMNNAREGLILDGVVYPLLDSEAIPVGYAQVDITLEMDNKDCPTTLIAGAVGTHIQNSMDKVLSTTGMRDTAAPAIGWWWSIKGNPPEQSATVLDDFGSGHESEDGDTDSSIGPNSS